MEAVECDMTIELTQAEHELLVMLLQEKQRQLLHEISKADVHEFRRNLQEKEAVLEALLRKASSSVVAA